jgi:ribosomal protein L33
VQESVITLECKIPEGVYRYTTTKNRRNTPNQIRNKKVLSIIKKTRDFKE